ncbi:MAG: hypothetical protein CVU06_07475 [Bacteroidetes bacterium HGW-Bacteroidetes-22]|nr:MAG: hypothetical protein CVU06_07475 [Bacteroidetes bacterium HGW-Bacteroidetes-22]
MKKILFVFGFAALAAMITVSFTSCTKEGPAGKDGEAGINGTDGTATCIQCHDNTEELFAKQNQWAASTHATGGNYARSTVGCADCHTSQGFRETVATGQPVANDISNANPINCYTCHEIHKTYTPTDWALTTVAPVTLMLNGASVDFGTGNLCANCHQSRPIDAAVMPVVGGPDIILTAANKRYGSHHGPQANIIGGIGTGLYEVGTGYVNSAHTSLEKGCVTCHLSEGYGNQGGGHVMNVKYGTSYVTSGCTEAGCHDATAVKQEILDYQAEIQTLLDQIKAKLVEAGIANEGDLYTKPGTYSADVVGAFLNHQSVTEDKSLGVHNPRYVKKLLENTLAALN